MFLNNTCIAVVHSVFRCCVRLVVGLLSMCYSFKFSMLELFAVSFHWEQSDFWPRQWPNCPRWVHGRSLTGQTLSMCLSTELHQLQQSFCSVHVFGVVTRTTHVAAWRKKFLNGKVLVAHGWNRQGVWQVSVKLLLWVHAVLFQMWGVHHLTCSCQVWHQTQWLMFILLINSARTVAFEMLLVFADVGCAWSAVLNCVLSGCDAVCVARNDIQKLNVGFVSCCGKFC